MVCDIMNFKKVHGTNKLLSWFLNLTTYYQLAPYILITYYQFGPYL